MKKTEQTPRFEERLEELEKLTARMEEGQLGLEELLALYEKGTQLAQGLKKDLDSAQAGLMELKDSKLKPAGEA